MTIDSHAARSYRLIDADSHVNEPPDLWQSRVPAAYRDRAPHMEHFEQGDAWVLEGVRDPITFGLNAAAGLPPGETAPVGALGGHPPGRLTPRPGWPRWTTDGSTPRPVPDPAPVAQHHRQPDPDFHLALVRAYNDWLAEYCASRPAPPRRPGHDPQPWGRPARGRARAGDRRARASSAPSDVLPAR